jgi:hypothetical protein
VIAAEPEVMLGVEPARFGAAEVGEGANFDYVLSLETA